MGNFKQELDLLIEASVPLIFIRTHDWIYVDEEIKENYKNYEIYLWNDAEGIIGRNNTESEKDADKDIEKKQSKIKHADFVTFTAEEYEKLKSQFGEAGAKEWTETLNLWKGSKGKKCASDYLTILSWARKDVQHGGTGTNTKPGARRSSRADASQDEWNSELSRGNQL